LADENSDAGHIKCSRGPNLSRGLQVPHPVLEISRLFVLIYIVFFGMKYFHLKQGDFTDSWN